MKPNVKNLSKQNLKEWKNENKTKRNEISIDKLSNQR